ncbi:MAG: acyltransferase [Bacteriovoracaceae bacterium]
MTEKASAYIHPTAIVEENVSVGSNAKIWHHCHVRTGSVISEDVSLGKDVFIDTGVTIEKGSRIQNGVSVYNGVMVHRWVFVGPNVTFTNDRVPRAGNKTWRVSKTELMTGCSIGAGSTIISDVTIGAFALIGAGSVVTESVPAFHLAYGLPAKIVSRICACGDSRISLEDTSSPIRPCCEKRLLPEVLALAVAEAKK